MFRYVALIWDTDDPRQAETAHVLAQCLKGQRPEWHLALESAGLYVCYAGANLGSTDPHLLHDRAGVVLGTLFETSREFPDRHLHRKAVIGPREAERIVATGGRELIDRYWGSYVAFLQSRAERRTWIVRAPLGLLPCFHTVCQNVSIYFSRAEDCLTLPFVRFSVNWDYLAAFLVLGRPQCAETGTKEVSEVQPGVCVEIQRDGTSRHCYWNPCSIAKSDALDDLSKAAGALRNETRACLHAWAARYVGIVVRLSGGVDSSIMVACLRDAPNRPSITCLNHYTDGPLGDERKFARLMAQHASVPLVEWERDTEFAWDSMLNMPPTVSPFGYLTHMGKSRFDAQLGRRTGAAAIFSGTHGDSLFHYGPSRPAAAEHLRRHGIGLAFLETALNIAEHERVSLYAVLRDAFIHGLLRPPSSGWIPPELQTRFGSLVSDATERAITRDTMRFVHPWLHAVDGVPLGKLFQISLLGCDSILDDPLVEADHPELVHPFISQPLAELCLRIPTYVLVNNGWDRALARQAFAQDLPEAIRRRTTKGSPGPWERMIIAHNATFVRELMLEGVLVRERLLDRRKLEAAMPGVLAKIETPITLMIDYVCAEIWARACTRPAYRAAAA